jgi:hypothetical protein
VLPHHAQQRDRTRTIFARRHLPSFSTIARSTSPSATSRSCVATSTIAGVARRAKALQQRDADASSSPVNGSSRSNSRGPCSSASSSEPLPILAREARHLIVGAIGQGRVERAVHAPRRSASS